MDIKVAAYEGKMGAENNFPDYQQSAFGYFVLRIDNIQDIWSNQYSPKVRK